MISSDQDFSAPSDKNFRKLIKILEVVAKEVEVQHRLRMDVWSESKRSQHEQESFKTSLIQFYQRQDPSDDKRLRCMILNDFFPRQLVIASHIWKYCTRGRGLEEFGLNEEDLNSPRNGILMCKEIEQAFDTKRLCFLVNKICSEALVVKVLDPALLDPATSPVVIPGYSTVKFCDIDGLPLRHPVGNLPFRRILNFHAKRSFQTAIKKKWLAADSRIDDYFEMSIGSSLPDFHVYQSESDGGDADA